MSASSELSDMARPVKLTVDDFMLLKQNGAFSGYAKAELLEGELWGVIRAPSPEEQWDDMVPILLNPLHLDVLRDNGKLSQYSDPKLTHVVIYVFPKES